jgi:hypothetical protein
MHEYIAEDDGLSSLGICYSRYGDGHCVDKDYQYYIDPDRYLHDIRYDCSARRWLLNGRRSVLNTAGGADICRAIDGIKKRPRVTPFLKQPKRLERNMTLKVVNGKLSALRWVGGDDLTRGVHKRVKRLACYASLRFLTR